MTFDCCRAPEEGQALGRNGHVSVRCSTHTLSVKCTSGPTFHMAAHLSPSCLQSWQRKQHGQQPFPASRPWNDRGGPRQCCRRSASGICRHGGHAAGPTRSRAGATRRESAGAASQALAATAAAAASPESRAIAPAVAGASGAAAAAAAAGTGAAGTGAAPAA